MLSDAKIEANRENAKLSTGPKTEEGKAKSAQNARKHGLSSKSIFIPEGRHDEFAELFESLFHEVRPVGEIQMQYFEQLVHASWHTTIARELLTLAYTQMDEKKIVTFTRLLGQHERAFTRTHKQLEQLQTDLAIRAIEENEPIADLPMTCQIKHIANEATRLAQSQERTQRPSHRWATLSRIGAAFRPFTTPEPAQPQAA